VSFADASQGGLSWRDASTYAIAQIVGALLGVALADAMFAEPIYAWSRHVRAGFPQVLSEGVATFGLMSVIWGCAPRRPEAVRFAVGTYITAALLVYCVDIVCESRGDDRSHRDCHVRRDSTV
jgi:glycerol uptake facilitator-like aquaporin